MMGTTLGANVAPRFSGMLRRFEAHRATFRQTHDVTEE